MTYVMLWYAAMSAATFVAFGIDKRAAQRSAANHSPQRIPEATLHLLELLGGFPGALAGQRAFRHKTYKKTYRTALWLVVALHAAGWAVWFWRGWA